MRLRWLALLPVLSLGCGDGPTSPRLSVAPSPTPLPRSSIAGSWKGTISAKSLQCGPALTVAATAHFSQDGPTVTGSISGGCRLGGNFTGTIEGQTLKLNGSFQEVRAKASNTHIEGTIAITDFFAPYGDLVLDRTGP